MLIIIALLSGLIFGLGLLISNMVDPAKVLGFLDITGRWDPSLAMVMTGAIGVGSIAFAFARRRSHSFLNALVQLPQSKRVDFRPIGGSLLFGAGWELAGFCPGPAIVAAAQGPSKAWIFVIAMLAGMALFSVLERHTKQTVQARNT